MSREHDDWKRMATKWGSAYFRLKEAGCKSRQAVKWSDKIVQRAILNSGDESLTHMVTEEEIHWAINKMPKIKIAALNFSQEDLKNGIYLGKK